MEEVYHMDGIKHNLLSILQICNKDYKVIFTFEGCRVEKWDTKEVILIAKKHKNANKADIMGMSDSSMKCLRAFANDPLLWHKRLGHASLKQNNKLL